MAAMGKTKGWKQFERLVAAIHAALDPDAKVTWNDTINGRQFDVTIRLKRGLYEYLTVIECKDYSTPVPVGEVDAFVTKSRDVQANYAVMASSAGYQAGALAVAKRHNVALLRLSDSPQPELILGAKWGKSIDALHVESVELRYADGETKKLPTSRSAQTYYVSKIAVRVGSIEKTLDSLISENLNTERLAEIQPNVYSERVIPLPPESNLLAPVDGEYPSRIVSSIVIRFTKMSAMTISGPVLFDPALLIPPVNIENLSSGQVQTVSRYGLALGTAVTFEPGCFYEQPQNDCFYYCDQIDGELATLYLVESFQVGGLVQAELTVKTEFASYYSPVTNKDVIERLKRRLARMKSK
jgi:Restriction endonuclease